MSVPEAEQGSQEADRFAAWVAPWWSTMTGLALRMCDRSDVDDVVQEALAQAWRRRGTFDARRGSARSWLLALTADQARRAARRRHRVATPTNSVDWLAVEQGLPDIDVREAISRLSERQRLAVELYYYIGLPVVEVAQVMGCAEGTVKSTLADARAQLRRTLEETADE